ncbi:phosphatase PAP2 family protein [Streptomyces sp. NPDC001922]|uniref:phosphatase PAP2 family protein n=1 Tax=Streptomyces sp. NPDC001922 TaxID=3364624 RepID=UPI0036CAC2E3
MLCAVLFALVTWQVAAGGPLLALDERLGRAVFRPHSPSVIAEAGADLGATVPALPVLGAALCWSGWLGRARWRRRQEDEGPPPGARPRWWLPPLVAVAVMAAVPALVVPLKLWIARPGPLGPAENYGWYPSGHAATAAVAYGAAFLLLLPHLRRALARRTAVVCVVLLNLWVGAGLVRRGYHWPLDVVGSWCLCGLLLWGVACAVHRSGAARNRRDTGEALEDPASGAGPDSRES